MKIKIIACTIDNYWYEDKIGDEFTLVDEKKHEIRESATSSNSCYVISHGGEEYVVAVADCETL